MTELMAYNKQNSAVFDNDYLQSFESYKKKYIYPY